MFPSQKIWNFINEVWFYTTLSIHSSLGKIFRRNAKPAWSGHFWGRFPYYSQPAVNGREEICRVLTRNSGVRHVALRAPNLLPHSVIHFWHFHTFSLIPSLKLTLHLKMDGWKTSFLLGRHIFRCELLVSGRVFLEKDHETSNTILLTSLTEVSDIIWDSSVRFQPTPVPGSETIHIIQKKASGMVKC